MVSCEQIRKAVEQALKRHDRGAVIVVEVPDSVFSESRLVCIEMLLHSGADGVYVSLEDQGPALKALAAPPPGYGTLSVVSPTSPSRPGWVSIPREPSVDDIVGAIQASLMGLKNPEKVIIIDSFEALLDSGTLAEAMRLSEFLTRLVRRREVSSVIIAMRSSFPRKGFIKEVAMHADEVLLMDG